MHRNSQHVISVGVCDVIDQFRAKLMARAEAWWREKYMCAPSFAFRKRFSFCFFNQCLLFSFLSSLEMASQGRFAGSRNVSLSEQRIVANV